jgi:hypothetical protein
MGPTVITDMARAITAIMVPVRTPITAARIITVRAVTTATATGNFAASKKTRSSSPGFFLRQVVGRMGEDWLEHLRANWTRGCLPGCAFLKLILRSRRLHLEPATSECRRLGSDARQAIEALGGECAECRTRKRARRNGNNASGIRLKALQGVGQKNPDADYAKQCGNCLDHNNCPLRPRGNKTAWSAEQSKEFKEPQWFRGAIDDFLQQRMSGRRQAAGQAGFRMATSRLKADDEATRRDGTATSLPNARECGRVAKSQMRSWPDRHEGASSSCRASPSKRCQALAATSRRQAECRISCAAASECSRQTR